MKFASHSCSDVTNRSCPVCHGQEAHLLHRQEFVLPAQHPLGDGYNVVSCIKCRFVYADTMASQSDYDRFYATLSKYETGGHATGGGEQAWDAKRLQQTARLLAQKLPSDARILDIGCANGGLLLALQSLGYHNICGLDPAAACVATTQSRGLAAHQGSLSDDLTGLGRFDCVILSHVLEHVRDVDAALLQVRELLVPDGQCYIEVPDATRYHEFYVSPFHFFDTEHINHFSLQSLQNLMNGAAFAIVARGVKEVPVTEKVLYPACWMLSTSMQSVGKSEMLAVPDGQLVASIEKYVARSASEADTASFDALLAEGPVWVWGIGCATLRLLPHLRHAQNVVAFVDNSPKLRGATLLGRPIIAPQSISDSSPIVIPSRLYREEIARQIQCDLQLDNPILYV